MIKKPLAIFIFLLLVTSTGFLLAVKPAYKIFIVQDSIRTEILFDDRTLKLRKAPFKIEVHLYNIEGVFASIASVPTYYNVPENKNFIKPKDIGPMCQAEENYNVDKDILLDNESFCYWYYDGTDTLCRFDKGVQNKGDYIEATMSVEKIFDPSTSKAVPVTEFTQPLYFVFFTTKDNKEGLCVKILNRKKVKVIFQ